MTFLPTGSKGPFLPTSQVYPEDESQRLIVHTEKYIDIAQAVNIREIGIYNLIEQLTGQQFFNTTSLGNPRYTYRTVYQLGALAAGATTTIAHGLTGVTAYTRIYGTAITATPDNRPIPYASATAVTAQIEINVDGTNITVVNGATAPNISSGIIVVEYLKN